MDPFTRKLLGASGEKVVSTMPNKMIEWFRSSSLYYASNQIPSPIKKKERPKPNCPEPDCKCTYPSCP